jgi:hypothetical protein
MDVTYTMLTDGHLILLYHIEVFTLVHGAVNKIVQTTC